MPDVGLDFQLGSTIWPGLSKLTEEAGEVLQVIGKLMATGGLDEHWDDDPRPLTLRLTEEIADLMAALMAVTELNDLDGQVMAERVRRKFALFLKWHDDQRGGR